MSPVLSVFLRRARRRVRLAWFTSATQLGVAVSAALAALIGALTWSTLSTRAAAVAWAAGALTIGLGLAALAAKAFRLSLPEIRVARIVDERLASNDALSAAVEFAAFPGPLADRIRLRADRLAQSTDVGQTIEVPVRRRLLAIGGVLGVVAVASVVVEGPGDRLRSATAQRVAAEQRAVRAAAEALRAEAESIRSGSARGDAAARFAAEKLERAAASIESARTRRSVDDAIASLQRDARQLDADPLARVGKASAVKGLNLELTARPLARGVTPGEQLRTLAASKTPIDPSTQQRLRQLAEAVQGGDPALGDALRKAAEGARSGDPVTASNALRDAASASDAAARDARESAVRGAAANRMARAASSAQAAAEQGGAPASSSSRSTIPSTKTVGPTAQQGRPGGGVGATRQPANAKGVAGSGGSNERPANKTGPPGGGAGPGGGIGAGTQSNLRVGEPNGTLGVPGAGPLVVGDADAANGDVVGIGKAPSAASQARAASAADVRAAVASSAAALRRSELAPSEEVVVRDYFDALTRLEAASDAAGPTEEQR